MNKFYTNTTNGQRLPEDEAIRLGRTTNSTDVKEEKPWMDYKDFIKWEEYKDKFNNGDIPRNFETNFGPVTREEMDEFNRQKDVYEKEIIEGILQWSAEQEITKPEHYNFGNIECIEAIEASMSKEAFRGYLKGNVQKYVWRYEYKGGTKDLKKAQWYLTKLIEKMEK